MNDRYNKVEAKTKPVVAFDTKEVTDVKSYGLSPSTTTIGFALVETETFIRRENMKINNWNANDDGTYTVDITHFNGDETAIWTVTREEWLKIRQQELDDEINNTDTSIAEVISDQWKRLQKKTATFCISIPVTRTRQFEIVAYNEASAFDFLQTYIDGQTPIDAQGNKVYCLEVGDKPGSGYDSNKDNWEVTDLK